MNSITIPKSSNHRNRPLVWVKEIRLYKTIDPLEEIRPPLLFTMGLNIIQGESNDSDQAFESGHGIGKTTLCRLIRYCLGEKTFGQSHIMEEVNSCFADGYVGALIELDGSQWAVLRPLGNRRKHITQQNVTIQELVESDKTSKYESFVLAIEEALLKKVPKRDVLSNGQQIQWLHLLAMCSRDQESRYDRFWNWRHSRSESSTPKFAKPKVDAGLCVRTILGFFDPNERELRAVLEKLEADLPKIRAEIERKKDEPRFYIDSIRQILANTYEVQDALNSPIDTGKMFGLIQSAKQKQAELNNELNTINERIPSLNMKISLASASYLEQSEMSEQTSSASDVTSESTEVMLDEVDKFRKQKQRIEDMEGVLCKPAQIMVGACSIVKAKLTDLNKQLEEYQAETSPEIIQREQVAVELTAKAEKQQRPLDSMRERLEEFNAERDKLLERRGVLNELIKRLPNVIDDLLKWDGILSGTVKYEEQESLQETEKKIIDDFATTKESLHKVVEEQRIRAESFAQRFNKIVQGAITAEFNGAVLIEEDSIGFRVNRGNLLFGEAYETLAVLLADIALMIESSRTEVAHPGFLLHDSPREADLNYRIYEKFLELAHSLMQEARIGDDIPYQYIVTTTTSPPKKLCKSITLHQLSSGDGSLFGRQLEVKSKEMEQPTLFDMKEGE
ncbi:hypothetical protein [Gimesia sp.]|uniref:hypothetical protein n=1 Tax=Gimesia sp. TaxID=2024833 RepID=UPI003A91A4C0